MICDLFVFIFLFTGAFTNAFVAQKPIDLKRTKSTFLTASQNKHKQHVPVIGPIPGAPPLLLGGELIVDQPTPFQWQTLHEAVMLHQKYLKEQSSNDDNDEDSSSMTTGIDAAPIVAVIDDVTGKG